MKEPMIRFGIAELWQPKSFELAKPDSQNLAVQSFHYVFPYVHWVINGPQNVSVITLNLYILIREIFIRLFSTDPSSSESLSIQVDRAAEAFCAVRNPKRDLLTWLESNLQSHTQSYTLHICLRFLNFDPMFVHNLWINITRTNGCNHFSPLEKSLLWFFMSVIFHLTFIEITKGHFVKRLNKQKTEFDSFNFSYSELSIGCYCKVWDTQMPAASRNTRHVTWLMCFGVCRTHSEIFVHSHYTLTSKSHDRKVEKKSRVTVTQEI